MKKRASGILLHITSLPSPYGIGDLGPTAYEFIDFLHESKQKYWQILPIHPTESILADSPYSSNSAFAGNPLLISPEAVVKDGYLDQEELNPPEIFSDQKVDYDRVRDFKENFFNTAYQRFKSHFDKIGGYKEFCEQQAYWLEDYALFVLLKKEHQGRAWNNWPAPYRDREEEALRKFEADHHDKIEFIKFVQYLFFKQWAELQAYARQKDVHIMGDIPIYVNFDSADVWSHSEIFKLDEQKNPLFVSGAPPDYFSETGQRWGNPVYDWAKNKKTGYAWWIKRMEHNFQLYDWLRIDHFRGFMAYWEIPAKEKTAKKGKWEEGPRDDFFVALKNYFAILPIVAEDLGYITPDVTEAMHRFNFPGMKVLLFAFDGDPKTHPYIPENYTENYVVYTGTHDNNTAKGWLKEEATPEAKENVIKYFGRKPSAEEFPWMLIECAMKSKANTAMIPLQDVLGLGQEARMNTPATMEGNWQWRVLSSEFTPSLGKKLLSLTEQTNRA